MATVKQMNERTLAEFIDGFRKKAIWLEGFAAAIDNKQLHGIGQRIKEDCNLIEKTHTEVQVVRLEATLEQIRQERKGIHEEIDRLLNLRKELKALKGESE